MSEAEDMKDALQVMDDQAESSRNMYFKDAALGHVVGLYMANATKDTNPGKSYPDMSKSVHDLIGDAVIIEQYLRGELD